MEVAIYFGIGIALGLIAALIWLWFGLPTTRDDDLELAFKALRIVALFTVFWAVILPIGTVMVVAIGGAYGLVHLIKNFRDKRKEDKCHSQVVQ